MLVTHLPEVDTVVTPEAAGNWWHGEVHLERLQAVLVTTLPWNPDLLSLGSRAKPKARQRFEFLLHKPSAAAQ